MENLTKLFEEITEIRKEAKRKEEFNPFITIGMNNKEIMHSKFISFMLDPKANHNKGKAFLNLFLQEIPIALTLTKTPVVCTEKGIKNNRRIDIVIEHSRDVIIIENKFWAVDQDKQLEDYYSHYLNLKFDNIHVLYLTPYGKSPSHGSAGENFKMEMVKCISYEKHILGWLKRCSKITEDEFLKGSIEKYAELVEKVINRDKYMEKVFEYMKEDENKMSMAIDVYNSLNGRNFFEDKVIQHRIEQMFSDYLENSKCYSYDWVDTNNGRELCLTENDSSNREIGAFYLYPKEIYAEFFSDKILIQDKLVAGSHIVGNNLSDDRLKAILTNKTDVIHEYLENCISQMREKTIN